MERLDRWIQRIGEWTVSTAARQSASEEQNTKDAEMFVG
jgi:hypothetical protein